MTTLDKLIAIRSLIAAGWCQFKFFDVPNNDARRYTIYDALRNPTIMADGVCFCTTGAIGFVNRGLPQGIEPETRALWEQLPLEYRLMKEPVSDGIGSALLYALQEFNDDYRRRKDDILALIDAAIISTPGG